MLNGVSICGCRATIHTAQNLDRQWITYVGLADVVNHQGERPIQIAERLRHAMPAELSEENRRTL
jgi:hypothetical protein